ncbi:MAG: putative peptidase M15 [Prokaryotic dsDNA virus sp.]|nr:MAG: putative peptidase M15 [Prokaryotic dsDNA virus sp.]|tara:strand:+ start:560 stop:997 length:438 start_codon:yes stop_codon:yes gene_type:complete
MGAKNNIGGKDDSYSDCFRNISLRYFKREEFDSPDVIGSGCQMDKHFLSLLDSARHIAGVPFKINSGFRTPEYNKELEKRGYKVAKTSPHMKGLAVDIATPDSVTRYKVMNSLMRVGFTRFGVGKGFIHVDCDEDKTQDCIWHYY